MLPPLGAGIDTAAIVSRRVAQARRASIVMPPGSSKLSGRALLAERWRTAMAEALASLSTVPRFEVDASIGDSARQHDGGRTTEASGFVLVTPEVPSPPSPPPPSGRGETDWWSPPR